MGGGWNCLRIVSNGGEVLAEPSACATRALVSWFIQSVLENLIVCHTAGQVIAESEI
jgi:hypothetical protein